jgi:hypothetical protein
VTIIQEDVMIFWNRSHRRGGDIRSRRPKLRLESLDARVVPDGSMPTAPDGPPAQPGDPTPGGVDLSTITVGELYGLGDAAGLPVFAYRETDGNLWLLITDGTADGAFQATFLGGSANGLADVLSLDGLQADYQPDAGKWTMAYDEVSATWTFYRPGVTFGGAVDGYATADWNVVLPAGFAAAGQPPAVPTPAVPAPPSPPQVPTTPHTGPVAPTQPVPPPGNNPPPTTPSPDRPRMPDKPVQPPTIPGGPGGPPQQGPVVPVIPPRGGPANPGGPSTPSFPAFPGPFLPGTPGGFSVEYMFRYDENGNLYYVGMIIRPTNPIPVPVPPPPGAPEVAPPPRPVPRDNTNRST